MTQLRFTVLDIGVQAYATTPNLAVRLRVQELAADPVHAIALRCQVRIEPQRRGYGDVEEELLLDIFGRRPQWSSTVRPFLWTHTSTLVQGFTGSTEVELELPCSYDFEVSASKYLHALRDGEIPLVFLFNGTVFSRGETGYAVHQLPWDAEAAYLMPVAVWRAVLDQHFPNSAWLRLGTETFEALQHYRTTHALLDWDETMTELLRRALAGPDAVQEQAGLPERASTGEIR
ncbi:MAG: DUF6084 family protein [Jatrophihabitans sp.]